MVHLSKISFNIANFHVVEPSYNYWNLEGTWPIAKSSFPLLITRPSINDI